MMLGKRCTYGSHVVLQVNSKDVFGCNCADFHVDQGAGFFFEPLFIGIDGVGIEACESGVLAR